MAAPWKIKLPIILILVINIIFFKKKKKEKRKKALNKTIHKIQKLIQKLELLKGMFVFDAIHILMQIEWTTKEVREHALSQR